MSIKNELIKDLMTIPGVGKSIANDLQLLGYKSVAGLKDQDPEKMYEKLCVITNSKQDKCLLYVFRCAVYYASNDKHDAELLKWWNWK